MNEALVSCPVRCFTLCGAVVQVLKHIQYISLCPDTCMLSDKNAPSLCELQADIYRSESPLLYKGFHETSDIHQGKCTFVGLERFHLTAATCVWFGGLRVGTGMFKKW